MISIFQVFIGGRNFKCMCVTLRIRIEWTSCHGTETLKVLLQNELGDKSVECRWWVMTDSWLLTQQSGSFIKNLVSKVPEQAWHHYTVKKEARYFQESKENLKSDQCIILADVSLNYSFICQDSIQGFTGQTVKQVHHFAVYIKDQHLQTLPFGVISDCIDRSTLSLEASQRTLLQHLYTKFSNLHNIM